MTLQFLLAAFVLLFWKSKRPTKIPTWRDFFLRIFPCGLATGLDIGLSNNSLEYISLTFYTMVKSGSPVFVLLFAFLFQLEKPNCTLIAIIGVIVGGVLLMVIDTFQFSFIGYLMIQSATILAGLRWALTQILLSREGLGMTNPLATTLILAPVMAVTIGISSGLIEDWSAISTNPFWDESRSEVFAVIFGGGFLAFIMVKYLLFFFFLNRFFLSY